ncbi:MULTISPECIES: M14 family metallopeptidase [Cytobacillus]|uniref:Peptidase M14 n=1 Tax=Cytobacillus oceanisediminis 2691 TaxID=1196031 RepID=A0A160MEI3_9BACI|nr:MULTISPECIES: M14 family metallopeptidase [Cytobacillus]MBY0154514.1 LysM peptidoglycan-binding domain-containing protein [Cytobacillus firmus]AND41500.1 peptidase M14 [Cytobacillus oceanisediminis 2691]MCM3393731.1 M14 family metallopeptidase [Cytobacillus oceanisediminis]MCM3529713.1 M14 family metallopeptidase [Cytobacillus oceanisediminis]UQX54423.1 M14 family metallopeptidase [Cytobacillus pseudoceanisediminis]
MKVKVRSGDSIWYYSQLFMVPINLIADSNPGVNPALLQIGQEINIPGFTLQNYTVRPGDTFWKLSTSRNLSVDALLLVNQSLNPNSLAPGTAIKLPRRVITPIVSGRRSYAYKALTADITMLSDIYPFIKVKSIGQSVLGKPIQEIRLGKGNKKVQINASFHANEWITTPILMALLNSFLLSITNVRPIRGVSTMPLYNSVDLSIVPMVNPDGVDLVLNGPPPELREEVIAINRGSTDFTGWKANIRGVDLNNQYPAKWDFEKERSEQNAPAPRDYLGEAPLTEPEAIAMAELAKDNQFDRMLAFHTQGAEFYWGFEGLEPPESQVLALEFERVSGYKAVQYIDSFAGYKDWFIQEFRRPGFTIELGRGINPLPLSQFDDIYEEVLGIFLASLYM